jgi:energy-coupling factor transporter ATP-binding protein EcfA2
MRLTKVYVRFYKSFNYDYERKFGGASPEPWEKIGETWYPFVHIDLEASISTVVGANESGKSHLLDAIEKVITGKGIEMADFCRYSHFFSVEQGQRRTPDFGCEFEVVDDRDVVLAKKHLGLDAPLGARFKLFRLNGAEPAIYQGDQAEPFKAGLKQAAVDELLPAVFRLDAHLPLPDSIPVLELDESAHRSYGSRRERYEVDKGFLGKPWAGVEAIKGAAAELFGLVSGAAASAEADERKQQFDLARKLLFNVANVDKTTFNDLSNAIMDGKDGYANAVIQKVNDALATHLNFPRWWAQDREFKLLVSRSEFELVFTIRDRTGTDYSFAERSNGLKYFLSYHVQLLAHRPPTTGQAEILLMDEPDAYLSSQGQQDLLRILEEFALPEARHRRDQVVYVTHSPFLINRNAADRIRVLDKGVTDEGTRVVKDVARNHYEPLRSALGAFVAETSFIGGSNLFVEGSADQVLLAGVSSHLLSQGAGRLDTIDLNTITIVPSGSASSIPYLVYLARGRDVVRPPCVALLDGDQSGIDAAKALAKGGGHRKEILPKKFIVNVGDWAKSNAKRLAPAQGVAIVEPEDLIGLAVAIDAARNYAVKFLELSRGEAEKLDEADLSAALPSNKGSMFDALTQVFGTAFGRAHIEKVGFAKEVVATLAAARTRGSLLPDYESTEKNFGVLLAHLASVLRTAEDEELNRRLSNRLERLVDRFLKDFPNPTTRENGRRLVDEASNSVEDSDAGERVKLKAAAMRRDFHLDEDLTKPIENFPDFRERVRALRYEERLASQDDKVVARVAAATPEAVTEAGSAQPVTAGESEHAEMTDGMRPEPGGEAVAAASATGDDAAGSDGQTG